MIKKEQIAGLLIESCPSFKATYDLLDTEDKESHYTVAGEFAVHLLKLYQSNSLAEFTQIAELIELLYEGDDYVKEYATVGILEGIQNVWGHSDIDPDSFEKFLLPQSKKEWQALNEGWAKLASTRGPL